MAVMVCMWQLMPEVERFMLSGMTGMVIGAIIALDSCTYWKDLMSFITKDFVMEEAFS